MIRRKINNNNVRTPVGLVVVSVATIAFQSFGNVVLTCAPAVPADSLVAVLIQSMPTEVGVEEGAADVVFEEAVDDVVRIDVVRIPPFFSLRRREKIELLRAASPLRFSPTRAVSHG